MGRCNYPWDTEVPWDTAEITMSGKSSEMVGGVVECSIIRRKDVRALLAWRPIVVNDRVLENAWLIQDRCQLSWWDSLVVSAAKLADCRYLITEDLKEYQEFGKLRVTNPFHVDPASLVD